ncbi:hypothetical protein BN3590_04595 [Clostridium sp. C105KSO15]|nr:hypothetical protein BN3590_04595 [Clostridium sp. C105KSO15]
MNTTRKIIPKKIQISAITIVLNDGIQNLSLIHISEPTRLGMISYAVFCLKKKKYKNSASLSYLTLHTIS